MLRSVVALVLVLVAGAPLLPGVLLAPVAVAVAFLSAQPAGAARRVWREVTIDEGYVTSILETAHGCLLTISYRDARVVSITDHGVSRTVLHDDSITFPVPGNARDADRVRELVNGLLEGPDPVEVILRFEASRSDSTLSSAQLTAPDFTLGVGHIDDAP